MAFRVFETWSPTVRAGFALIVLMSPVLVHAQQKERDDRASSVGVELLPLGENPQALKIPPADLSPSYRRPDPSQILAPPGYVVELYAASLDFPVDVAFDDRGEAYIAEGGFNDFGTSPLRAPSPQIIQLRPDGTKRVVYDEAVPFSQIREAASSADMPEGLIPPISGLTWHGGKLYVAHRSRISVLDPKDDDPKTRFKTIVNGLPEWGNSLAGKPQFDRDGKLVFFVPTQGNAGVVDEHWAVNVLFFNKLKSHEIPGEDVTLTGRNFHVPLDLADEAEPFVRSPNESVISANRELTARIPYGHRRKLSPPPGDDQTGAFAPLWTKTTSGQVVSGEKICNGAFFRCDADGSGLERIAWGFRSSGGYRFSADGRLICTQNGAGPIRPRGPWFDFDAIYEVVRDEWYGWPDFLGGLPIDDSRFQVMEGPRDFLLTEETHRELLKGRDRPRPPLARLTAQSGVQGLVFGRTEFGVDPNSVLVAEMGTLLPHFKGGRLFYSAVDREERMRLQDTMPRPSPPDIDFDWPGFKVQIVDLRSGKARDFLVNQAKGPATAQRGGGLERPFRLEWGPDGALYVVDLGIVSVSEHEGKTYANAHASTGVVWRIRLQNSPATGKP